MTITADTGLQAVPTSQLAHVTGGGFGSELIGQLGGDAKWGGIIDSFLSSLGMSSLGTPATPPAGTSGTPGTVTPLPTPAAPATQGACTCSPGAVARPVV